MQIIPTSDGSHTLYVPEINEHYHSILGAVQESEAVFIRNGLDTCSADPVHIFEAGFGTGLNALLSAVYSTEKDRKIFYTAIEKYPLSEDITKQLNYSEFIPEKEKDLFALIHSCPWNKVQQISANFTFEKINGDLLTFEPAMRYDLVYYDAFSPDKQPEMWTAEAFRQINCLTSPGSVLVTYSVKGDVKRGLRGIGFRVKRLPGPPGKRHILRAVKI